MADIKFLDLVGLKHVWAKVLEKESALQSQISSTEGQINGFSEAIQNLTTLLDSKVSKEEGKSLISEADLTKLANLPADAEANTITGIKFNGQSVEIDSNKIANIVFNTPDSPVVGVVDNDNFLAIDDATGKLKSNIIFGRENVVDSEGKEVDSLVLKGNGQTLFSVAVADFVADGMLDNVELNGDDLKFTFNTAATTAGKKEISVDLSKYIKAFEPADDSIIIEGNKIRVANPFTNADKQILANLDNVFVKKESLEADIQSLNTFMRYGDMVALTNAEIDNALNS